MNREDHDIKWYEHEIIHYRDKTGNGEHRTKERYHIIMEESQGYIPDDELTPAEFTQLANQEDTDVQTTTQTNKLTGATETTKDRHMETAYITTTKVIPE